MKKKVLFICIHNSARSQMAEAFLNQICGGEFEAHSAGLEPGKLNPIVVEAMAEVGLDISGNKTKSVFDTSQIRQILRLRHYGVRRGRRRTMPRFPGSRPAPSLEFSRPVRLSWHPCGSSPEDA